MIDAIVGIFGDAWVVVVESTPFIVLGLMVAGLLHIFLDPALVARQLGRGRVRPVVMASVLGVPLPLCSCGVLPAALAIRRQGANDGAVTSFLVSTPSTGVDSIAVTYALLGSIMAVVRPIVAFVSGVATGLVQALSSGSKATMPHQAAAEPCKVDAGKPEDACCSGEDCPPDEHAAHHGFVRRVGAGLRYGFVELLGEVSGWFLLGVLIAGVITFLVPEELIGKYSGGGLLTMLVMLVVGAPLYACSSASVPIAAALIVKGLSPGAALVFLMAGPATNATSLTVVGGMLGRRAAAIYIGGISVCAVLMGLLLDAFLKLSGWTVIPSIGTHGGHGFAAWRHVAAAAFIVAVVALFASRVLPKLRRRPAAACPHCADEPTSSRH